MRVLDQAIDERDRTWRIALAPDPWMPHAARRYVGGSLRDRGWTEERCGVVELLTSEVVTNAFRHAVGPAVLMVAIASDHVRVTVEDGSPAQWPSPKPPGEEGGWGMLLVQALATGWGFSTCDTTKAVWFELDAA
ncbi:MAG: putative anti-sigma regulatory factor, serine/threonine protein kinase [Acidimicrobiales bacterium]|jgi:anti-sigma regulatory factor (Ser/Thr protein kinase)|nr:putative anti-sigma regulatory factor, serine/threonine protein kinase [Acidimicrobiales bacterium]